MYCIRQLNDVPAGAAFFAVSFLQYLFYSFFSFSLLTLDTTACLVALERSLAHSRSSDTSRPPPGCMAGHEHCQTHPLLFCFDLLIFFFWPCSLRFDVYVANAHTRVISSTPSLLWQVVRD